VIGDKLVSLIRTAVPIWVGVVLTWIGQKTGIVPDAATAAALSAAVVGVLATLYYALARWLESRWPSLGWLLGSASQPTYGTSTKDAPPPQ
jgi:hypothetical protein